MMTPSACPRCGGWRFVDREDNDVACLICGGRLEQPWEQEQRTADGKRRLRAPSYNRQRL